ncbi:MAG: aminopeptidase P family N-terminal domain-containing protein [Rhodospirillales bacterium]|jgi:hypothetical protein|nr:aminopeptidase P family N-terminal domain-containing protein [Rhodospirillales bacterium]
MRRGLLSWSEEEVPKSVLDARVNRLQDLMREEGLDAVIVYTNFPRPAAVSYLTHFIPYWSQGILLVGAGVAPILIVSLSNRVKGWMEGTSHVGEVICTPNPGLKAAELIKENADGKPRIGIVELPKFGAGLANPLRENLPGTVMEDATALYAQARHPADEAEINLTTHAAQMAAAALDAGLASGSEQATAVISAVDGHAREAAAEEAAVTIAPDLTRDAKFQRLEGPADLGERYAIRISLAYKGHWVRLARSVIRDGEAPESWAAAEAGFQELLSGLGDGGTLEQDLENWAGTLDGARLLVWTLEGVSGSHPLGVYWDQNNRHRMPPAGGLAILSLRLDLPGGPWLASAPLLLGDGEGGSSRALL